MRALYTLLVYLLTPFVRLYLRRRARKQPAYLEHWDERWARWASAFEAGQPVIWLHAVSVGETRAAAPLVRELQARYPAHRILLTCMTPTGRETALSLFGDSVTVAFLPYDYPEAARRFLQRYQPVLGVLLETEIWPNLVAECQRAHVPLLLVNARLSDKSFRGYQRLSWLTRPAFAALTSVLAQSEDDADRLRRLGCSDVTIVGNLKFDNVPPVEHAALAARWRERIGARQVLLLASTREGEEALLLDALKGRCSALVILVPRHPQRFDEVAQLLSERGLSYMRRSQWQFGALPDDVRVLLGDSMGEMAAYFAAADVAVMGGSILDFGCQNPIEACAAGTPCVVGPSVYNFSEVVRAARQAGALDQRTTAAGVIRHAQRLLLGNRRRTAMRAAGLAFAAAHRGATARTVATLARWLNKEQP
ncbi:lipid IV(A) 3-deoxy-D-manno-octulosonic acid transferase [Chitinibacteraceae bacterium HSL-7]